MLLLQDIRLRNPFTSHDNKSALILDASGFGQVRVFLYSIEQNSLLHLIELKMLLAVEEKIGEALS